MKWMICTHKKNDEYYRKKDAETIVKAVAISAITATVVSVIVACNADFITLTLRRTRYSAEALINV